MSCGPPFRFFGVDELEEFHEDIVTSRRELDGTGFFFFQIEPRLGGNIFVSDFFSTSAASRPIFFPITGIRLPISGKALDRSDRLSRLMRAFLYDRFKIYLIVPIVWIELNSIQAIEVVSDVWVVWDRPGSVPIWSFRSCDHYSRRLGRSGRSYAWKPGFSKLFAVASSFHSL